MDTLLLEKLVQDWAREQPEQISQVEISFTITTVRREVLGIQITNQDAETKPLLLEVLLTQKNITQAGASKNIATLINNNLRYALNGGRHLQDGAIPTPLDELEFSTCTVEEFLEAATPTLIRGIPTFGLKCRKALNDVLSAYGYTPIRYDD